MFAALLVILGTGTLICVIGWWWTGRPCTAEREAVQDAPDGTGYSCLHCRMDGGEHDVWCRLRPTVVASDDLTWQVDLAKIYRDYDTYKTELRLPGERAS